MIEYKGQLKDYNWNIRKEKTRKRVKNKKGKTSQPRRVIKYIDDIITFDIETTSAWLYPDGTMTAYVPYQDDKFWKQMTPVSIPYIWQCSVNDTVYYGRYFDTFLNLLDDLPEGNIKIWVHNLSFEFEFLQNILTFNKVFGRTPHSPMYARCEEYPDIQFQCSYVLSNLSLEKWGESLGLPKMVGDLDYLKIRTPLTKLTKKEMKYCERDCEVVYTGIKDLLRTYTNQWDIPMTSTGKIRRVIKTMLTDDPDYVKWIKKLVPRNPEQYRKLIIAFAGGYTHTNYIHAGDVIDIEDYKHIGHADFASSYPACICMYKYPSTPWVHCGILKVPSDEDMERNAYLMHVTFKNIRSTNFNTYIQSSKCNVKNAKYDNGRIRSADWLEMESITEVDFQIIRNNYEWDEMDIVDMMYSVKAYLPKKFIEYVLELYGNKTKYKDVEGKEDIYSLSKTYINAMYGMMVTALIQADVIYDPETHDWTIEQLTAADVEDKLDKLRNWSPYEKRYFLNYSWGIYVTAYARFNLWKCINSFPECGYNVLYCDTDSIFYIGDVDWTWYNNYVDEKLKKMCDYYNIDFNTTRPSTPKGKIKPLGHFELEDDNGGIVQFKSLGAKRYIYKAKDDQLHLTVSGINKSAVNCLKSIDDFKDGCVFDKDHPKVKKMLHTYITDQPTIKWPDGYVSTYKYGINLRKTGYKLTMTDEYSALINNEEWDIDITDDYIINMIRRNWV